MKASSRLSAPFFIAAMVSTVCCTSASATQFQFSYSFPTANTTEFPSGFTSASGMLTATPDGPGTFLVTNVTGTWNGDAITGVAALNAEGENDNLIFPSSSPVLDLNGLAFSVAGPGDIGNGLVDVFYCTTTSGCVSTEGTPPPGYLDDSQPTGFSPTFNLTEIASVPEPLTLSLFGAGLLGAATMRKRKTKAA